MTKEKMKIVSRLTIKKKVKEREKKERFTASSYSEMF